MGEYRVDISELAKQDIRDVTSYINNSLKEPAIAEKLSDAILDAIFTLEDMPSRIGLVNDECLAKNKLEVCISKTIQLFFV